MNPQVWVAIIATAAVWVATAGAAWQRIKHLESRQDEQIQQVRQQFAKLEKQARREQAELEDRLRDLELTMERHRKDCRQ